MKSVNGDMRMDSFLNAMFQNGAASYMDVISFHPYPFSTDLTSATSMFQQEFAQIRKTRDYWAPSMRLWVSETGLSLQTAGITQALQATTIPAIYDTIAAMPQRDVDVVVVHTLVQSSGSLAYGLGQLVPDATGAPLFVPTPDIWRFRAGSRRVARHEPPQFRGGGGLRPTLCPANIVLTMAMSWGRTLEGVHQRSRFRLRKRGVRMDSGFSGFEGSLEHQD